MNFPYAALSAAVALTSVTAFAADYPAPRQGEWIAKDFKFHTGDTMPELRLHYTTIGEPTGQPVLVLHGSGGSAASMLTATFGGEMFGAGQPLDAAKYYIIIPDGARPRQIVETFRRHEDRISEIQLRGHGRCAVPPGQGRPRREASAARDRQFDGRHAHLDLGRQISAIHGRAGADGLAADRDGGAQLDAAADDAGNHPERSRLQWRQLHRAAAHDEIRHQRLWHCDRRRHAGLSDAGADRRKGRQDGR